MSDVVKHLERWTDRDGEMTPLGKEAAAEIRRLRAREAELEAALNELMEWNFSDEGCDCSQCKATNAARAALAKVEGK